MKKFVKLLKKIPILMIAFAVALAVSNSTLFAAPGRQDGQSESFFVDNNGRDILAAPIEVNGELGYCSNAYLATPTGEEYQLLDDAYREPTIRGALFYGFGGIDNTLQTKYSIPNNQARYATQVVLTQHLHEAGIPHNFRALDFSNLKSNAHSNLLKYARELYTKTFDTIRPITLTFNGNSTVQGNYQVSDAIRLSSSIEYNVTVSTGEVIEKTVNSFKVKVPLSFTGVVKAVVKPISKNFKTLVWRTGSGAQDIIQINKKDPLPTVATNLNFTAPKGSLELLKIDGENTNTKLQNAVFELLKDNRVIATATSNAEGKVLFNDLLPGDYVVREKTAPTGYRLNTNTLNVTVQPGQTNRQNFSNFKIKGNIEVIKQDGEQHSTKLEGAVFELKQGNTVVATATANAQGIARFTNVAYGEYTIVEKQAPTGYRLNPNTLNVTVSEHQRTYQLAFNNFKIRGNVEVLKVDAEDNNVKLIGVTFALLKNGNEVATAITDTNGVARFTNVEYGAYEVQEKATLENYVLSTTKYPVNIQQHNQIVNITAQNQKVKGSIEVLKVDAEDNNVKLPGVTFALLKNGNEVATAITDTNGVARFTNVEYGAYEVQEKATLENYVISLDRYRVFVSEHDVTYYRTAENKKIKGNIEVLKVAEHDNTLKLEGAVFELRKGTEVIATATTNAEGVATFENIEYGTYQLVETKAPEGYFLKSDEKEVVINQDKQVITFRVENEKKPSIKTTATGANGEKELEPVGTIVIKDTLAYENLIPQKETTAVLTWMDKFTKSPLVINGKVVTSTLVFTPTTPNGTIEVSTEVDASALVGKEIVAFESIQRNNKEIAAHADFDDEGQTIRFKELGKIRVRKVDAIEKDKPLAGAEFTLYRDGKAIAKVVSKEDGIVTFDGIIEGVTYEIKETNAPLGYIISDDVIKVQLSKQELEALKDKVYEIVVDNEPLQQETKPKVKTNDASNNLVYGLSVLISVCGILLMRKRS